MTVKMRALRSLRFGLRRLLRPARAERELADEIELLYELTIEELIRGGLSREQAQRAARLRLGHPERHKETVRESGWEAALELAKVRLDKHTIRAPFGGVSGIRKVSPGAYVTAGQPIVNVEKIDTLKIDFKLPELYLSQVSTGQQIEIAAVYDGYLQRQEEEARRATELEAMRIPPTFDFANLKGLSYESVEKLGRVRPTTVGQASRMPGVRPADIALLIGHLRVKGRGSRVRGQEECPN